MDVERLVPIRVLHDFVGRLDRLGIEYMLTGSMAMWPYSVYRFTADLDVVLELKYSDAPRIVDALLPDYYVSQESVTRAISNMRMFNIIHQETAYKVDCVIRKPDPFQRNAFDRRQRTDYYGKEVSIIAKDDLVISKLWWAKDSNSEKQLTDVQNLLRNEFDAEYIRTWTNRLGVSDLFDQCLKEIRE